MISLQIIIDKIVSTHFDKMKLCAFIFAVFKKESDCIIIEIPLNEISPQMIGMFGGVKLDNSFAPLVTSSVPNKIPLNVSGETKGKIFDKKIDITSKIFNIPNASEIR